MMKLLLAHAANGMVPTKTVHSKTVLGMVQILINTFMTISALVTISMTNVKVKRKKALAMEQSTVSIQLNLLTKMVGGDEIDQGRVVCFIQTCKNR